MRSTKKTIYQQILHVCQGKEGSIMTTAEIKSLVVREFGTSDGSILPSDLCYNRINKGIAFDKHLFERIGSGKFKFLGERFPFTGDVSHQPKGTSLDIVVGEWKNGEYRPFSTREGGLSQEQIQRLYDEYLELLKLEVGVFGVDPTEVRHLIGRIGEFKSALLTHGTLARRVNQAGFDVIAGGRTISVKTTAQTTGFISINLATIHKADDLMALQFVDGDFRLLYHGLIARAVEAGREYQGRSEIDLSKLKALAQMPTE